MRGKLLDEARIQAGHRLLDIGCGTGTFAIAIKRRYPDVQVVGLDPDPKALTRAHLKAAGSGRDSRCNSTGAMPRRCPTPTARSIGCFRPSRYTISR